MAFSFKSASFDPTAPVRYELDSISDDPERPIALWVLHAGHGNGGFMSALVKKQDELGARFSSRKTTAAEKTANREADVDLFADYLIVKWENVVEDGKEAPCEPATVRRFLLALCAPPPEGRPDVFDNLRLWARNPENFRAAQKAADELGKR